MLKTVNYILVILLLFLSIGKVEKRIFLIGDSTVASYPEEDKPMKGWGQLLGDHFNDTVKILNFAKSGESSKSFRDSGLWDEVIDRLEKGDYLFIQFGHNDQKKLFPDRYTHPFTSYKTNLIAFAREAKQKGAFPIIVTPVCRRKFNNGRIIHTLGDYPSAAREAAKEENIPIIDLNERSYLLLNKLGREKSKELFLHLKPGKYEAYPEGREDDTHFSEFGARKMAKLIVEEIKENDLDIGSYLKP